MANKTGYAAITGYDDIKAMLKKTVVSGKVSHAYIFCGEAGSGKTAMASAFVAALQCAEKDGEPCMECAACKKVASRNHPDITVVRHEKPDSIGVAEIRQQVVEDVAILPFESKYKIYVIPEANLMTPQAQNAVLKTLEEPPSYVIILLIAESTDSLLPTVVSRCITVKFNALSDETVCEYLEKELLLPKHAAALYASLAMGKIGTAKRLALSDEFSSHLSEAIRYLRSSKDIEPIRRIEINKRFAANKKELLEYLDIFTIWFRDVLLFKATREKEDVIMKDELTDIKKRASVSSYEGIQNILDAIDTARGRLKANVNAELVTELLLLTISEN